MKSHDVLCWHGEKLFFKKPARRLCVLRMKQIYLRRAYEELSSGDRNIIRL
jgi:hypothetical protein